MAVTEDVARLRLETVGVESLDALRTRVTQATADIYDFADSYDLVEIEATKAAAATHQVVTSQAEIAGAANQVVASTERVAASTEKARGGVAGFGQSAVQAGRFLQDFQAAGVMGVANNLEQLSMALGGGPGLAGGLTLLAVAYLAFKPQIEEFFRTLGTDAVDPLKDRVTALKEHIKELEDKPHKIAVDVAELDAARRQSEELKANLSAVEKMEKTRGHYEKESGQAIEELFAESQQGAPAIKDALRRQFVREQEASSGDLREERGNLAAREAELGRLKTAPLAFGEEDVDRQLATDTAARMVEESRARIDALKEEISRQGGRADDALGKLITGAEEGTGLAQRNMQRELARRLGQAGMGNLGQSVQLLSPERLLAGEQADETFEAGIEERKRQVKERDDAAQKRTEEAKRKAKEQEDAQQKAAAEMERFVAADERESARLLAKRHAGEKKDKAAEEAGTKAEAKRIEDTVGKQRQLQYEGLMAENQARIATGAPGAVDPRRLAQRLQAQMVGEFRQRGAAPESAALAAKNIAGAGQQDLTHRQSLLAGRTQDTQAQTLMLTRDLMMEYQKLDGTQRSLHLEVQAQRREMQAQRARSKSRLPRTTR